MTERKRGLIRGAFDGLTRLGKGALGYENARTAANLARNSAQALKLRSCPRCHEFALAKNGISWACGSCGFKGTEADIERMQAVEGISATVFAAAKGHAVNTAVVAKREKVFSWMFWTVTLFVLAYSLYWLGTGAMVYFIWTLLVSVLFGIHAIKRAYNAQYLKRKFTGKPIEFLSRPKLWFVH